MCQTDNNALIAKQVLHARAALLQFMEVIAKHNAAIRTRFPVSHAVRQVVESNLSGTINDAPFAIQLFIQSGEDAACLCERALGKDALDIFTEGVAEIIEEADRWAGDPWENQHATPVYPKTITITSEHLLQEIQCRARNFFDSIYGIACANACKLHKAESGFWSKYRRAAAVLNGAKQDHSVAIRHGTILSNKLPTVIAREVLSFLVRDGVPR